MKYTVNEEECIGCGMCAETCSTVFSLNQDHTASAADISDQSRNGLDAMRQCPTGAIKVKQS